MARLARVVVPGIPHHITQRGNRRQQTFFADDDYAAYRDQLAQSCVKAGVRRVGLAPDAQPCPPDPGAGHGRKPTPIGAEAKYV